MGLYFINKFVTVAPSDGDSTRVPTLKVKQDNGSPIKIADNKGMSKALYDAFFYPPPEENNINPGFVYPSRILPGNFTPWWQYQKFSMPPVSGSHQFNARGRESESPRDR